MNIYPNPWDKNKDPYGNVPQVPKPWKNEHEKDKHWHKEPAPITINDLFPGLDRWGIGWSPILQALKEMSSVKPSYPPYDIIDQENNTTLINVAVAGFTKKQITITEEEKVLTVEGKKESKETSGTVIHNGIAGRDFKLSFALAEFYEVDSAKVEDGILTIKLVKNVPDEKKPKVIDIK